MKKTIFFIISIAFIGFSISFSASAQDDAAAAAFDELRVDLKKYGVPENDIEAVKNPVKELFKRGARKEDVKKAVSQLSQEGVKGRDLKKSMDSMNDLVKNGENPKDAGNIVSKAAHDAKAQGLKGKDLAAKVHEAIQKRKQERNALKEQKKKQKKEGEEELEKGKGKAKGKNK